MGDVELALVVGGMGVDRCGFVQERLGTYLDRFLSRPDLERVYLDLDRFCFDLARCYLDLDRFYLDLERFYLDLDLCYLDMDRVWLDPGSFCGAKKRGPRIG